MNLAKCRAAVLLLILSLGVLCLAHQAVPLDVSGGTTVRTTPNPTKPSEPNSVSRDNSRLDETPSPAAVGTVIMTIVYDNRPFDPALATAWGFSCLAQTPTNTVLFDTGGDGAILMANMSALQIDIDQINAVVLSHNHRYHTGACQLFSRRMIT